MKYLVSYWCEVHSCDAPPSKEIHNEVIDFNGLVTIGKIGVFENGLSKLFKKVSVIAFSPLAEEFDHIKEELKTIREKAKKAFNS